MAASEGFYVSTGLVGSGEASPVLYAEIEDGNDLDIGRATLILSDGQPAPTGLDLVIATVDGVGSATLQETIISGDGTEKVDETGESLVSYINNSGSPEQVGVFVDNGHFGSGTGSNQDIFASVDVEDIQQPEVLEWSSQSDWDAATSTTNVDSGGGSVILAVVEDDFDSDATGNLPSRWTDGPEGDTRVVDDFSESGAQSLRSDVTGGTVGVVLAERDIEPFQYSQTFQFWYRETSNSQISAVDFTSSSGDSLITFGSNNPQFVIEDGDGGSNVIDNPSPNYDVFRRVEVTFDWDNQEADVAWFDPNGSTGDQTFNNRTLKTATTYDVANIEVQNGGETGVWGGTDTEQWNDDITALQASSGNLTTATKSFINPQEPNFQNLSYSLNGESADLVAIGSPGSGSEEEQSASLDGSTSFTLSWSQSHTDFRVRFEPSTSDQSSSPILQTVQLAE